MLDQGEADDKIIAVLNKDYVWSHVGDLTELPAVLIERLRHYFLTYKLIPGEKANVSIGDAYGRAHAEKVIEAAINDYEQEYGAG